RLCAGGRTRGGQRRQHRAQTARGRAAVVPGVLDGLAMRELVEQLIAGIAAGGIYASLALALVLIYRAMGLINFAQGEFAIVTAFICWTLLQVPQVPYFLAVVIAVVVGAVGAFAIERLVVRPFERGAP